MYAVIEKQVSLCNAPPPFFLCSRITNEEYHFTPLLEPAKEGHGLDRIETLTVYRDSGQLQLNGTKKMLIFYFSYLYIFMLL